MEQSIFNITAVGLLALVVIGAGRWLGREGAKLTAAITGFIERIAKAQEDLIETLNKQVVEDEKRTAAAREHLDSVAMLNRHDVRVAIGELRAAVANVESNLSAQVEGVRRDVLDSLRHERLIVEEEENEHALSQRTSEEVHERGGGPWRGVSSSRG